MDPAIVLLKQEICEYRFGTSVRKSGFRIGAAKIGNNSCKNQAIVMIFLNKYTPRKGD